MIKMGSNSACNFNQNKENHRVPVNKRWRKPVKKGSNSNQIKRFHHFKQSYFPFLSFYNSSTIRELHYQPFF
jgi:hypothetical protein